MPESRFSVQAVCGVLLVIVSCQVALAQRLRSPWDDQKITLTEAPYKCPDPPPFEKSINAEGYYTDEHHSVIDPAKKKAFEDATEAPTHLGQYVGLAADAYLTQGSKAAAQCAYSLLLAAAKAEAWSHKMPTNQATYEQKWLLSGTAMAYLKVRDSGAGSADDDKAIQKWFGTLAGHIEDYVDSHRQNKNSDAWNNHGYWAGLAVAAAGVARNNRSEFQWGLNLYKTGVLEIGPQGQLPRELDRAAMALHYHLYALGPLVMLAELGEANGLDLYAVEHGAIQRLAKLCEAGLANPEIFTKATGVQQNVDDKITGFEIGWAVPYVKRYPNAQLSQWIAQAPTVRFWQWGGLPPGWTGS
jgi:poly(beta-D-mannuronate) lyase